MNGLRGQEVCAEKRIMNGLKGQEVCAEKRIMNGLRGQAASLVYGPISLNL
jgi:hypothetical protein